MGKIFYIMGKSASGKDHFYEALLQDPDLSLEPLVLYTTRPIRSSEQDGREYFFVDEQKLVNLRLSGKIIEERVYQTIAGPWYYFTADEGQIDLQKKDYLGIGTLESCKKMREYFGPEGVCPLYVETEDGIRLQRALKREEKQETARIFQRKSLRRRGLAGALKITEPLRTACGRSAGTFCQKNNAVS